MIAACQMHLSEVPFFLILGIFLYTLPYSLHVIFSYSMYVFRGKIMCFLCFTCEIIVKCLNNYNIR